MLPERVETLIVGGGQAGLAMSHMLKQRGCPHFVLEQARAFERWRSERWDGLRFQFPNWSVELPDFPFCDADPDGFATSAEIVDYLDAYVKFVKPPGFCGVKVTGLRRDEARKLFVAETSSGSILARNVVLATGPYQRPVIPEALAGDIDLFQVHANAYKRPDQLPAGAVLIVGSGASGSQIAEELSRAGRQVYLSVGRHKRMPRRYRGRDLSWWLREMEVEQTPVEQRGPDTTLPLITGAYGGHTIDFREFAAQGITLVGRLKAARDGILHFAADLRESLDYGDAAYNAFVQRMDGFIEQRKLQLPAEIRAQVTDLTSIAELDARAGHSRRRPDLRDLGDGLHLRFPLDRPAGARRKRRTGARPRRGKSARHLFPGAAMAVPDELLIPVRCRGRCRATGGSYSRRRPLPSA